MTRTWPNNTRILIVEDDRVASHLYSYRLELEGIEVVQALNGDEALDWLQKSPFQIVVTDLLMPGMGGLQLIRHIRNAPQPWRSIPILVISESRNEHDQMDAFQAGANDYMSKPISSPILMERLYRLLQSQGQS